MKRILIAPFLLTIIASAVVAQETTWQRYTVKGEEFSVNLPTLPAMATNRFTGSGTRETWERRLGAYADGVAYTIYSLDDGNPKKALKNAVDGFGSNHLGWNLKTPEEVTRDDFAGKQYVSAHELGGMVQVFATEKHYYRFQAFGAPPDDPRVQQFFSSLLFGKNNDGIEVIDGPGIPWEPTGEASDSDEVYPNKSVDRKAILLMKIEPSYTEEARNHKATGTIVLRVVFSSTGNVTDIVTLSALPYGLTEQAIEAVKKTRFIPAMKGGKLVSTLMQFEFNFDIY